MDIKSFLSSDVPIANKIEQLKGKTLDIPSWSTLRPIYEPTLHKIVNDKVGRRDKYHKDDGGVDKAARIYVGLEKLHAHRITDFTVAIPVVRNYSNLEDLLSERKNKKIEARRIIEAIYRTARINAENQKRVHSYYASCEMCTVWFVVKKRHNMYGFPCDYKIKCKSYSPMDGVTLYPLFDETEDMLAMSFEYTRNLGTDKIVFFECYTDDRIYKWQCKDGEWSGGLVADSLPIKKIPCIYAYRLRPVYYGLSHLREDIEYTLSRNSDVVAYNSAPILHVSGGIKGQEHKGESYRIFRTENGGSVQYVSWQQAIEALRYQVNTLTSLYWQQAQMPDISFENMKSLGNIGYDARMTLLTDAHLKIGEESGALIEFFEREYNVIKAFLSVLRPDLADVLDEVDVEHVITPYIQKDDTTKLALLQKANGNKPVISQLDSIREWGKSSNPEETQKVIINEAKGETDTLNNNENK